jgi:hypothetical protein
MKGLDSDYNLIIHTLSENQAIENYPNLTSWQIETGNDLHSITLKDKNTSSLLSKLFTMPTTSHRTADYNLNKNSPLHDMETMLKNSKKRRIEVNSNDNYKYTDIGAHLPPHPFKENQL